MQQYCGRRRESTTHVFILLLSRSHNRVVLIRLLQFSLQKETPQQPGVLIRAPLEKQLAVVDVMVISRSYTRSVLLSPS